MMLTYCVSTYFLTMLIVLCCPHTVTSLERSWCSNSISFLSFHLIEWGVWIFSCNNMNFMKNATFYSYTYVTVAATHVSWTSFTLFTEVNMTVQHSWILSVSQPSKFILKMSNVSYSQRWSQCFCCLMHVYQQNWYQPLVKVGYMAFGGVSGAFQSLFGSFFTILLPPCAKSGLM